jgi:chromosome segregation ATPase
MDQLGYLNYRIKEYKNEKEKLNKQLEENKSDKQSHAEKIEKEIKNYKYVVDTYVKTCSQLTEELMTLRKEIDRLNGGNSKFLKK